VVAAAVGVEVSDSTESLLKFPTDVPVKVFGRNDAKFRAAAIRIAEIHYGDAHRVVEHLSKKGNYLSLTITVHAKSRAQIDALYSDLVASDEIIMVI
jgi:putative lipoic acid-binding regulatory protein